MTSALLAAAVDRLPDGTVVALSGAAGAGKTTLAAAVGAAVGRLAVVPADDFLDPAGCAVVTDDWAGLERDRLREEVLTPFRRGLPVRWQRRDWVTGALAEHRTLPPCTVLLVEGVGLLHPSLRWDLAVWLDVPPAVAAARGIARDGDAAGWDVWSATDQAYLARFRPDLAADLLLPG